MYHQRTNSENGGCNTLQNHQRVFTIEVYGYLYMTGLLSHQLWILNLVIHKHLRHSPCCGVHKKQL